MKLLVLADIHGYLGHLPLIEPVIADCDGIVVAGDITDFGGAEQVRVIISKLSAYGKPLLAVPGNCDLKDAEDQLQQNKISLHGRMISCCGLQFVGVGGSLPCPGTTPNEAGENDFYRILEKGASSVASSDHLVLVTHQPAWGVQLDMGGSGRHTGSQTVREFIERFKPILAISGHMHEAYGVDQLGPTTLVNPGPFRQGRFAVVEIIDKQVQVQLYP